jgi:hypothetical protein
MAWPGSPSFSTWTGDGLKLPSRAIESTASTSGPVGSPA